MKFGEILKDSIDVRDDEKDLDYHDVCPAVEHINSTIDWSLQCEDGPAGNHVVAIVE